MGFVIKQSLTPATILILLLASPAVHAQWGPWLRGAGADYGNAGAGNGEDAAALTGGGGGEEAAGGAGDVAPDAGGSGSGSSIAEPPKGADCGIDYAKNVVTKPEEYVKAHNDIRAKVGLGPVTWNKTLEGIATEMAKSRVKTCNATRTKGDIGYGENIFIGFGTGLATGVEAVQQWGEEKEFYSYETGACSQERYCGHYTQVVWRDSTQIGCARMRCEDGWWFVVCDYYPKGNIKGKKPY